MITHSANHHRSGVCNRRTANKIVDLSSGGALPTHVGRVSASLQSAGVLRPGLHASEIAKTLKILQLFPGSFSNARSQHLGSQTAFLFALL